MSLKMKVPKDVSEVSFNGERFSPDKGGFVIVPDAAAGALAAHGLMVVANVGAEKAAAAGNATDAAKTAK